jgi:hypothetical protein
MNTTPLVKVRRQLIRYAYGRITLAEFEEKMVPLVAEIREEDRRASNLLAKIDDQRAQYAAGRWTEAELRAILRLLADEESQKRRQVRRPRVRKRP